MSPRRAVRALANPVVSLGLAIALVGGTGVATAATGGSFILGRTNYAGGPTALRNTGAGSALHLGTASNSVPPLTVGTNKTRVPYLNSDLVDGLDSTQLQRRVTGTCPGGAVSAVGATGGVTCTAIPAGPTKVSTSLPWGATIGTPLDTPALTVDGVTFNVRCSLTEDLEGKRLAMTGYFTGAAAIVNGHTTTTLYSHNAGDALVDGVGIGVPASGLSGALRAFEAPEFTFSRQSVTVMVVNGASLRQWTLHLFADGRDLGTGSKPCTVWGTVV